MKNIKKLLVTSLFLISGVSAVADDVVYIGDGIPRSYPPANVAVTVNKDRNVSNPTKQYIFNIFTLRITSFENGDPIKVVMLPQSNEASKCLVYRVFEYPSIHSFYRVVEERSERTNNVIFVDTEKEVIELVKKSKNHIGYVDGYFIVNEKSVKHLEIKDN